MSCLLENSAAADLSDHQIAFVAFGNRINTVVGSQLFLIYTPDYPIGFISALLLIINCILVVVADPFASGCLLTCICGG